MKPTAKSVIPEARLEFVLCGGCGITTLDEAMPGRALDVLAIDHADRFCFGPASVPWDCRWNPNRPRARNLPNP